jgi:signal transduction histidine kinase
MPLLRAMEAITNAQKHSGSAAVTISIRFSEPANGLALEVYDAGLGFDPRARQPGSGLQNMRDRLTALGGRLNPRSEPGAGTWLLATFPSAADLLQIQRPGMVSRR